MKLGENMAFFCWWHAGWVHTKMSALSVLCAGLAFIAPAPPRSGAARHGATRAAADSDAIDAFSSALEAAAQHDAFLKRLTADGVTPMESFPALRGRVATGFGRGSKKLGVPTANLPCSLFQEELASLPTGVYLGWARVGDDVHQCVANVGFSPTFADAQNPEKIVEAHLLADFAADFYGEPLALLLLGFVRDERKFSGLDELLATIRADIETARAELEAPPLQILRRAPWLTDPSPLPADEAASFELLEPTGQFEGALGQ